MAAGEHCQEGIIAPLSGLTACTLSCMSPALSPTCSSHPEAQVLVAPSARRFSLSPEHMLKSTQPK